MKHEALDSQIALIEQETRRQILAVYDGLYYDFINRPAEVWEEEAIAERIEIETLEEMVSLYSASEQFEKCAVVQKWIDAIETSKGLLAIKQLL
jgi:hypothetical protein